MLKQLLLVVLMGGVLVLLPVTVRADIMVGTDKAEVITGTNDPDFINAKGGDDVVFGKSGADVIYGFGGKDTLWSGPGADQLFGGDGNDILRASTDDETHDNLDGGAGTDTCYIRDNRDLTRNCERIVQT